VLGRLFKWLLVLVLILVVALGGVVTWLVVRGFPQREGTVSLPGLTAPVRVVRDQNGIANISAKTTEDLFAAQGWVHASERMYQMEIWRRIGAGRLAELFGSDQVGTDSYVRTLGWRHAAEADLPAMSPSARAILDAYAQGVNAWLDSHGDLPLPFVITGLQGAGGGLSGFRPEPWTALDTLTWQKVQAWSLGDNMGNELTRMLFKAHGLTDEQIAQLNPAYDNSRPSIVESSAATPSAESPARIATSMASTTATTLLSQETRLRSVLSAAAGGASMSGSNGFVVAPSRSATGGALLANDPHLGLDMPSLWFLVGLHCEPVGPQCPFDMAGAGFPGTPGLVLGHNAHIAWGLTNVGPDVQDIYEETVDPDNPNRYMYEGESRKFDTRTETIHVSGGNDVDITVYSTVHGPLISQVDDDLKPESDGGRDVGLDGKVYALAWTGTMPNDTTLESVLDLNAATNWDEFRAAAAKFDAPSQTLLYADVDGHIGVQIPGRIPIRPQGDGSVPVPGESGDYDWSGFIPFEELPYSFDPPSGFIVASNNQVADPAAGYGFIGREFDPGYRAARITELLSTDEPITTDMLRSIQGDTKLTRAVPVVAAALDVEAETDDGKLLQQQLRDWQDALKCGTDSQGCAAYETFEYRLERGIFDDELGAGDGLTDGARRYIGTETAHELVTRLVAEPDDPWWDDTSTTDVVETADEILVKALDEGAADLRTSLGDPQNWTWGRIHTITFEEQTLGSSGIAPLEWIFNKGAYAVPGSCTTVLKTCVDITEDWPAEGETPNLQQRFDTISGPSYRLAVDMSKLDEATIIQTTGQSGLPFDSHYGDYIQRWIDNQPFPLPFTADAVEASKAQVLTLEP